MISHSPDTSIVSETGTARNEDEMNIEEDHQRPILGKQLYGVNGSMTAFGESMTEEWEVVVREEKLIMHGNGASGEVVGNVSSPTNNVTVKSKWNGILPQQKKRKSHGWR